MLKDDLYLHFKTRDLYAVLKVSKEADEKALRRGYYLAAMQHHPDKVDADSKDEATTRFQVSARICFSFPAHYHISAY